MISLNNQNTIRFWRNRSNLYLILFLNKEFATIESNLAAISQKRMKLKSIIRPTILDIKKTFKELRELKKKRRQG